MNERSQCRRGMTLIELMVSLGLLTAVLAASTGWITISGQMAATGSGPLRWEVLAHAALRCIEDDLIFGDFEIGDTASQHEARRAARVQISEGLLALRGRDQTGKPNTFTYRVTSGFLVRSAGAQEEPRRLMPIARFDVQVDGEHRFITIVLISDDGREITRRYRVP